MNLIFGFIVGIATNYWMSDVFGLSDNVSSATGWLVGICAVIAYNMYETKSDHKREIEIIAAKAEAQSKKAKAKAKNSTSEDEDIFNLK